MHFLCLPWPTRTTLGVSGPQPVEELCAEICALPHTPHRRLTWTCWVPQHRYWQYVQKDPAREKEEKIREGCPLLTDNHLATAGLIASLPSQPVIQPSRLEITSEIIESNLLCSITVFTTKSCPQLPQPVEHLLSSSWDIYSIICLFNAWPPSHWRIFS